MALIERIILMTSLTAVLGQRPFFAGSRPIGYPEIVKPAADDLANRFGDGNVSTTTQKLPLEALGDRELVNRLSKLPVDQQPFWLINWQALENHRKNPQTYPQRPSPFVDTAQAGQTLGIQNSNPPNTNLQNRFTEPANANDNGGNSNDFNAGRVNKTFVSNSSSENAGFAADDTNIDKENSGRKPGNENFYIGGSTTFSPNTNKRSTASAVPISSSTNHYSSGVHHHPSATVKPNNSKTTSKGPDSGLTHTFTDFYDDLDIDLHNGHLNTDIKKKQKLQQQQAQSNIPLSIYDLYF